MTRNWEITGEEVFDARNNPLDNPFYGYRRTKLRLPDGQRATYHGLIVSDTVHVVAVEDDLTTYLVRQKRPNAMGINQKDIPEVLELPGGFADERYDLAASANRELEEEAGLHASNLEHIGTLYPSVGVSNEKDHIFLGRLLEPVASPTGEATEQGLQVVSGPFGKLYDELLHSPGTVSAQTVAALSLASVRL